MNRSYRLTGRLMSIFLGVTLLVMCVPPEDQGAETPKENSTLDSLRNVRCPRLMSSAAEYYRNQDWPATVRIYKQVVDLGCDESHPEYAPPEDIYLYYAIAYEYQGKYDSSEFVLLKGLQKLPDNLDLRKRLAYSYKKQNEVEKEIVEYERMAQMAPEDKSVLTDLADLYSDAERYKDQIEVLRRLIKLEPANEIFQNKLAIAYEKSGQDPLEFKKERYEKNPGNVSFGMDYAESLNQADRSEEAIDVLKNVISTDNSSSLAYRTLAETYKRVDNLDDASNAYEEVFKLDPRDYTVAIQISDLNIELRNFDKALRWAEKAIQVSGSKGESIGQKGKVYYKAFQTLRGPSITDDDRIVASLADIYFKQAEEKGYNGFGSSKEWLSENEVLFTKANWFMLDPKVKNRGYVLPQGEQYGWVTEKLNKQPSW